MLMATFSCGTVMGLGHGDAVFDRLGVGFDQRREIGAGVGEEVLDAAIGEELEIGVGDGAGGDRFRRHGLALPSEGLWLGREPPLPSARALLRSAADTFPHEGGRKK
jgi:hypothetical protein